VHRHKLNVAIPVSLGLPVSLQAKVMVCAAAQSNSLIQAVIVNRTHVNRQTTAKKYRSIQGLAKIL